MPFILNWTLPIVTVPCQSAMQIVQSQRFNFADFCGMLEALSNDICLGYFSRKVVSPHLMYLYMVDG
jgi:hypothetical protein